MKKLFTITLLLIGAFTVKAQNMSFDETVKYINDKIDASKPTITAKKDGTITIGKESINLFDLYQEPIDGRNIFKQYKGIVYDNQPSYECIRFTLNSQGAYKILAFFTIEKDEERVYNALIYLRSLCTQSKDPFDK